MSKSKCSSGEGVDDGRIDLLIVPTAVAIVDRDNVEFIHKVGTEDNWEPLIICYVLK